MARSNVKIAAVTVVIVAVLATAIGLIAHFTRPKDSGGGGEGGGGDKPITEAEKRRVDCFPEELGGIDKVNETVCKSRGCVYSPSPHKAVPDCYASEGSGYELVGGRRDSPRGVKLTLIRKDQGMFGENIRNITFEVIYHTNDLIQFKVSLATNRFFIQQHPSST